MPESCAFTVIFHSRFRVGAAYGIDGVDLAVDRREHLPADHLKGVMRASADQLAEACFVEPELVGEVFGTIRQPCPWTWFSAKSAQGEFVVVPRNRVHIDSSTHSAMKDLLVSAEQAWASAATFEIRRIGAVGRVEHHLALLRLSALHTHHLGAWRRRGLGWVTMEPLGERVSAADDLALLQPAGQGPRE